MPPEKETQLTSTTDVKISYLCAKYAE